MSVKAMAYGAANIVSVGNKGAAFTVNFPAQVEVALQEKKKIQGKLSPELKELARETLNFFSHPEYGLKIEVENEIPQGLGKEEALSLALIFAVTGALAQHHGSVNELKIDKYWKEQFLMMDKKVVDKKDLMELCEENLNFSKLAASFYGGFAITEGEEILRRGEMEEFSLTLKKVKGTEENLFRNELNSAWKEALKGNLYQAMKINSLLHEPEETKKLLQKAVTVSFSPPHLVGLSRTEGDLTTLNQEVKILQKPKKIYKTNDFLELEGAGEFW